MFRRHLLVLVLPDPDAQNFMFTHSFLVIAHRCHYHHHHHGGGGSFSFLFFLLGQPRPQPNRWHWRPTPSLATHAGNILGSHRFSASHTLTLLIPSASLCFRIPYHVAPKAFSHPVCFFLAQKSVQWDVLNIYIIFAPPHPPHPPHPSFIISAYTRPSYTPLLSICLFVCFFCYQFSLPFITLGISRLFIPHSSMFLLYLLLGTARNTPGPVQKCHIRPGSPPAATTTCHPHAITPCQHYFTTFLVKLIISSPGPLYLFLSLMQKLLAPPAYITCTH